MIYNYRNWHIGEYNRKLAPNKTVLRYWNDNKENLYHLLGDNLIISKEIEYTVPIQEIYAKFDSVLYGNTVAHNVINSFRRWTSNIDLPMVIKENIWEIRTLISYECLAKSQSDFIHTIKFENSEGKTISLQPNCKPMKALKKLNDCFRFCSDEDFEKFRITVSQCLNQKKVKGELCLSIHPLDYMTMSDNNYGWSSCMSWHEEGCYRRGTVEMMNSPKVVVAYLNGEKPFYIDNEHIWSNKKWRQLFIIDNTVLASIKGYPYHNDTLTKSVMDWLRELASENWKMDFDCDYLITNDVKSKGFDFTTCDMYNDFDLTTHYVTTSKPRNNTSTYYCYYSGEANCMCCGDLGYFDGDEMALICEDCNNTHYCDCCGDRLYCDEDVYELDEHCYCENCYDTQAVRDAFTGRTIDKEDAFKFYLLTEEEKEYVLNAVESGDYDVYYVRSHFDVVYYTAWDNTNELDKYLYKNGFNIVKIRHPWSSFFETYSYITLNDVRPEWKEEIKFYNKNDIY